MKRKDISEILNSGVEHDEMVKNLLNLFHSETDTLKDQYEELQKQLQTAQKDLKSAQDDKAAAEKALQEHKDAAAEKEAHATKSAAYREMLKSAGIKPEYIEKVMKHSAEEIRALVLDDKGKISDAAKVKEAAKTEWAEYIGTTHTDGAHVSDPPSGKTIRTKSDIMAIKDASERQKAIAENITLFTK